MGIIQFSIFLRNTHQNQTLKSSSCTPCTLLLLPLWPLPALLKPPSSLELLLLPVVPSFLEPLVLSLLEVLLESLPLELASFSKVSSLEQLSAEERDQLKLTTKMLLSKP